MNKPDEFDFYSIMNEIPAQFDKAIKEMAKTAEMLGHVIMDNLEDYTSRSNDNLNNNDKNTPDNTSTPSSDNATNPSNLYTAPSDLDIVKEQVQREIDHTNVSDEISKCIQEITKLDIQIEEATTILDLMKTELDTLIEKKDAYTAHLEKLQANIK